MNISHILQSDAYRLKDDAKLDLGSAERERKNDVKVASIAPHTLSQLETRSACVHLDALLCCSENKSLIYDNCTEPLLC